MQLVMVGWPDKQIGIIVFALESGRSAEASSPAPQPSLVRTQCQRPVSESVVSLIAGTFIKVIQHDGVVVRFKRPTPCVLSVQLRRKGKGSQAGKNTQAKRAVKFFHHRNLSKRIATVSVPPGGHSAGEFVLGVHVGRRPNSVLLLDHLASHAN